MVKLRNSLNAGSPEKRYDEKLQRRLTPLVLLNLALDIKSLDSIEAGGLIMFCIESVY